MAGEPNESISVIDRGLSDQIRQKVLRMCDAPHNWMGKRQCHDEHSDVFFSLQSAMMTLPTPVPTVLTRSSLPDLLANDYWVCDKSQGSRIMVYALDNTVYFLDSRFFVFKVATVPATVQDTFVSGPTLLDAHLNNETVTVFDCIELNGVSMRKLKLSERLVAIGSIVIAQFRETLRPHIGFEMIGKRVHRLSRIRDIFQHLKKRSYRTFEYDDGKRQTLSRGLVFIPEQHAYRSSHKQYTCPIYKWSFPGQQSVDFKVKEPFSGTVKLYCTTEDYSSDILCAQTTLTPSQAHKMLGTDESELIVRCIWNNTRWCVVEIRKDRNKPDTFMGFVNAMESMLDVMTKDELMARLEGGGGAEQSQRPLLSADTALRQAV